MALTAARVLPVGSEILPRAGGRLSEFWRLTGDGSDVDVVITSQTLDYIEAVNANGASHNITSATTTAVTLTFATAPGNLLTMDVELIGRKN